MDPVATETAETNTVTEKKVEEAENAPVVPSTGEEESPAAVKEAESTVVETLETAKPEADLVENGKEETETETKTSAPETAKAETDDTLKRKGPEIEAEALEVPEKKPKTDDNAEPTTDEKEKVEAEATA